MDRKLRFITDSTADDVLHCIRYGARVLAARLQFSWGIANKQSGVNRNAQYGRIWMWARAIGCPSVCFRVLYFKVSPSGLARQISRKGSLYIITHMRKSRTYIIRVGSQFEAATQV